MNDNVNHPEHYTRHPSGVECIRITEWMSFCLGNVIKYVWRAPLKGRAAEGALVFGPGDCPFGAER
jgi:hypothetical protein